MCLCLPTAILFYFIVFYCIVFYCILLYFIVFYCIVFYLRIITAICGHPYLGIYGG